MRHKIRNEEARGLQQMNRTPGTASSLSGRPGPMGRQDKQAMTLAQHRAALRREPSDPREPFERSR